MSSSKAPEKVTQVIDASADRKGELKRVGGSMSDTWNNEIGQQAMASIFTADDLAVGERRASAAIAGLIGIGPKDEIEGMIAAQLVASHNAAMECYRRAQIPSQTLEGRQMNLSQANKLSRTHVTLVEALNRHRGKGQQRVTVEHVHVHAGGQAVVGHVETGGGASRQIEDQCHATDTAASQPSLSSPNPIRDGMPIASDAEWSLQDARR